MKVTQLYFFLTFLNVIAAYAQENRSTIHGKITDSQKEPITDVSVSIENSTTGTVSNSEGIFSLDIRNTDKSQFLIFNHLRYKEKKIAAEQFLEAGNELVTVVLEDSLRILDQVDVTDTQENLLNENVSTVRLNPIESQFMPAPFQDVSSLLITLPGVSSRNEFSTGYSVRGGNFDENLVYVNDIPVYRPQIVTSGQQEGLGFVNTDLVKGIEFSSGGWESKYGDALASTLNVTYKTPDKFAGSLSAGLLGGSVNVEGVSKNQRLSYLAGARLKSSAYLLNTLETKGEYTPVFTDVQSYITYDISKKEERGNAEIGVMFSYAQNKYIVEPTSRESTFGTFNNQLRLFVAFDGREQLTYDTWQGGVNLTRRMSDKWNSRLILSGIYSREREYYDIENGYLLCNVDNNPSSGGFNKCLTNIGIGTNYYHGRNLLDATLLNVEQRNVVIINDDNTMEFGLSVGYNDFDDVLNDYNFSDSVDYVTIDRAVYSKSDISYTLWRAYWQNTTSISENQSLTYGLRLLMQSTNNQVLLSPRVQYVWQPSSHKNTFIRAAAGIYRQTPLYREFRSNSGEINEDVAAQSSFQGIVGLDVDFSKWGRPFKFTAEVYYKYLWNVNPYDVENVRIRYFADNIAKGYATGIDFRLSGDFIPGQQSWFSLGLMSTGEDLETDDRGYIPRPTDQRVNFNIFFQDHIPNYPTFQVHLRLLYSTGLPFSPPLNEAYRNSFRGSDYRRIDIGFSKIFYFNVNNEASFFKSLWLSFEILNLTGNENTVSYYWVNDVNNNYYAVPNALSQRFFNVRAILKFGS